MEVSIDQVFWRKQIMNRLFKLNTFLNYCTRADEFVVGGSAVVIPQPGAAPTVVKNNTTYPLVAVQRADTMVMYPLDVYVTIPTFIPLANLQAISYNKTESVMKDHFGYCMQAMADDQVLNWGSGLPGATNVLYTTGPATGVLEIGQVGSRNTCHYLDVKRLQAIMNKANVPQEGRVLLMESNMYDQLTTSLSATEYKDFSREYDAKTGTMGRLFGFDIMTRSSVLMAAAALDGDGLLAMNALGAALAATDNVGCLAWQTDMLELAMGSIHIFTQFDSPQYTGDVANVQIKAGGRARRADFVGVYALMQGTPA